MLAEISSLEAKLKSLNTLTAKTGSGFTSAQAVKELKNLKAAYHETMMASKGFQATEFTATTSAQLLTKRLATNTLSMKDYSAALKSVTLESNLFNLAGQRQVAVQNSNLMVTGKTATAYTALSVDMTNATIKSQVYTQAILAQKAALTSLATNIVNAGKNMQWAGRQLTAGLSMPAAMAGAGAAVMFNTIDKNLTRLAKVYGVGLMEPTVQELANVRKEVLALGTDLSKVLGISTNEVTDIAAQFAAAGLTGTQLISATKQASRMVVLGETDKQQAINATISLQTSYKLNTEQLTESVNFFNAAQAATSTSMGDLIEAIPRTGPIVRGLGGTYKDMVALLVAMKEGGVPAAEGANAIKNSMGRLINPTKAAQEQLRGFGIDIKGIVTKNAGDLIGMVTELQVSLDKLPNLQRQQAIAELFGKFQFARMAALMDNFNKSGTQSAKIVEMMGMSAGSLATIADNQTKKIQKSASGQFKIAVESIKNSLLPFGEEMLKIATKIIRAIESIVKRIEDLPGPIKNILKIGSAIALIAGPVLMIGGLFKNLFGNLFAKLFIPIFSMVRALQAGVNPLTILRSKFREFHVEETLAEKASERFASSMTKVADANQVMISGIQKQIAMIDQLVLSLESAVVAETALSGASLVGTGRPITPTQSVAMQNTLYNPVISSSAGTSGVSGSTFSHLIPKKDMTAFGKELGLSEKDAALLHRNARTSGLYVGKGGNAAQYQADMGERMPNTIVPDNTSVKEMRGQLEKATTPTLVEAGKTYTKMTDQEVRSLFMTQQQYVKYASVVIANQTVIAKAYETSAQKGQAVARSIRLAWETGGPEAAQLAAQKAAQELGLSFDKIVKQSATAISSAINKAGPGLAAKVAAETALSLENVQIQRMKNLNASQTSIRGSASVGAAYAQGLVVQSSTISQLTALEKKIISILIQRGATEEEAIVTTKSLTTQQKGLIKSEANLTTLINEDGTITLQVINAKKAVVRSIILEGDSAARLAAANTQLATAEITAAERMAGAGGIAGAGAGASRAQKIGTGAMAGSMALMMGGSAVGGTAGNVMATGGQSLMMGGMAASMLPASMMAGPIGPAIIGLAVALPLVIKGIKALQESAERFGKSMINAMTTSTLEAETFGIKVNDIGNFSFPKITKEAQVSANAVDSIVQKIKQLDGADPLAQMVESMKELSNSEVMSVIKQKYLTLRVQGVDAKAAQDFVIATLRAAGKEMAVGSGFNDYAATAQNQSTPQMFNDLYSNANFKPTKPIFAAENTEARASLLDASEEDIKKAGELAQTLFDIGQSFNEQGKASEFAKIIKDITSNLKEGSDESYGFSLSVEELYKKLDVSKDVWERFTANNVSAADSLMLVQLKAMGVKVDLDKLSKEPWRIKVLLQYGQEVMAAQDVATAQQALFDNAKLKTLPKDNSFQETPDQKAAKKAINAQVKAQELVVKAQELVVSNLEKEQKLRNNIADAQKRELDYAKSKADIQGQIQEALASGNVGKAVSLQNDLNAATANYNKELQTASDQRKIDVEKDKVDVQKNKLDAIKSKLDLLTNSAATTSTAAGKSAMKSYETVQKEILEGISKTIKVSSADVAKWTKTLNPYVSDAAGLVKGLVLTYEQSVPKKLSDSVVSSMSNIIDANNRGALSAAIFNEIQNGKNGSTASAVKAAIDALMPNLKAQITNKGKTVTVLSPTPVPGNQGRKSIDIQDIIQTYNYLTPDQESKLRNGNASGGHITGPGNGTSDSIPAYLSNGEYVIRASAVKQYGKGLFDNLNTQKFSGGGYIDGLAKFHSGGKVGYRYGGEVMAMLQGGEVVIPKEIVRHYENGGPVSNSNSSQYNINVSVNGSNASADEIAKTVMRTIQNQQNMISGPRYV